MIHLLLEYFEIQNLKLVNGNQIKNKVSSLVLIKMWPSAHRNLQQERGTGLIVMLTAGNYKIML